MKIDGDWQTDKGVIADMGFASTSKKIVFEEMPKIYLSKLDETLITMYNFTGGAEDLLFYM